MKQKLVAFLLALVICLMPCAAMAAQEDLLQERETLCYVEDAAGLLTQEEIDDLQSEAERLYELYGRDVVIVTTNDTDGKSAMEFADDYFDYNGYSDEGLLLLVDMGNREWWISTEGSCIEAFTDAEIQNIGEAVAGYLANGDYKGAFDEFLWHVEYELENYENAGGGDVIERPAEGTATVFVIDEAELLTEEEEQLLEEKIALLRNGYFEDIVIVTTNNTGGKSSMEYADDYYDYNGYADAGILLLIDMGNREWWISTKGTTCNYALNDRDIQRIGKKIAKSLKSEKYKQACEIFLEEVDEELYDHYDCELGPVFREPGLDGTLKRWWRNINWVAVLIAEAVAIVAAFIIVGVMKHGMKTARSKNQAQDYIRPGSFQLTNSADIYLYSDTTSRRIEHEDHSGFDSGGSSTHTSSSGDTHGGGGGSF